MWKRLFSNAPSSVSAESLGVSRRIDGGGGAIELAGVVSGLRSEADRIDRLLRSQEPALIALGVPPDDLNALREIVDGREPEEEYELTEAEELYASGLRRFGEIALPPEELLFAVRYARERGIHVHAVDLETPRYIDVFTAEVGAIELLWYSARLRKLPKRLRGVSSAVEFCFAWDHEVQRFRGFRRLEEAREQAMAEGLLRIRKETGVTLAILDAPRVAGVARVLLERIGTKERLVPPSA